MSFNSMQYALFFVAVFLLNYLLPKKVRHILLLIASYYFYMNWNAKYALLMVTVTIITYASAIIIEKCSDLKAKRSVLIGSLIICFGFLIYFKYINFIIENLNYVFGGFTAHQISTLDIVLPVGISFYIFQAVGYVIDVYRGGQCEHNLILYALFVSFFPQLVAGPIERSENLLDQLKRPHELTGERFRNGIIYILIGLFQKVVIADNIAKIINPIFENYQSYSGCSIILATMLFSIQIYCDFGGYSNIAIGSAKIFGVDLMKNFDSPYLATSVPDFWRRWHISLTSWFRDYLYIPLGGNRKGKLRKYINTFIVFFLSGAWHGAAWNYIFWGILNGGLIIVSNVTHVNKLKEASSNRFNRVLRQIVTFLLISFTWLFFRVPSLQTGFHVIQHSVTNFAGNVYSEVLTGFGDSFGLVMLIFSIAILFGIDVINEKYGELVEYISDKQAIFRWMFYVLIFLLIVLFGAYGEGYEQTQFIYFQF